MIGAPSGNTIMTIDIHPHIISTDAVRYPNAPVGGHKSTWSKDRPVSVEHMIVEMDQAGVAKSALVQACTCYGHDNSYVADAVAPYPQRFTGVFSVDPLASEAPEKIRYWTGRNLTGMRFFTAGSTTAQVDWVDDPQTYPAWECAAEIGIPLCIQMTGKAIPQLRRMLERFPMVSVILDHLAKPTLADGPPYAAAADVFALSEFPNLYLKVTPWTVAEAQNGLATHATFFPLRVSKFGASRIAWGSNYPASEGPLARLVKSSREAMAMLSDEDREWIFAKTALQLYQALAAK